MNATLPELVRARARAGPGAPAVSTPGARITYRELDEWSEAVARRPAASGRATGSR
ncbi:hypothetical protein [Saccharothrix xinjiangensis]|uniref:AMP-binding enzyme n=1 Tax=Saccharothrix xinjiangensis TaxID=204798 RepID=A0ABV9YDE2_9PSEU